MIRTFVLAFSGTIMCLLGYVGTKEAIKSELSLGCGVLSGLCAASGIILFTMI